VEPTAFTFHADDATPLAGTLYRPTGEADTAVLIAGALGVSQRFYAPFARWLAGRGHRVMTFDLRGMGASRQPQHRASLRRLDADMLTWARLDFAAAVHHLAGLHGDRPIAVVGHSLGFHHAGMTDACTQDMIRQVVAVASGSGYWRDWATPSRRLAPVMFYLAGPIATGLFGYFPGKRLGMVADLPAGVMRQWTRWCCHPEFAWGAEPELVRPSLQSARFPITAFSFSDDEAMTETCTRKLLAAFSNATSVIARLAPDDVGMDAIGHIGAFKPSGAIKLWKRFEERLAGPTF
jgi:predicted alpha/beta hydrolase